MTKTFTKNDLIRFIYDEVTEDERTEMNQAILSDFQLQEHVSELKQTMLHLEDFQMKAPEELVSRILYAERHMPSA